MSTDRIILPDFIIADLYKSSLVDPNDMVTSDEQMPVETIATAPLAEVANDKIKYTGDNRKHIVIVVNNAGSRDISKEDFTFLSNILKACQLTIADTAIVNVSEQKFSYLKIKEELLAKQILLFDVEPSAIDLPFKIPAFQLQNYADCTIMTAPALSALNKQTQEGRLLKTKLWNSLKQIFGL